MIYKTRDTLVYGSTYEGYPVMQDKGPFIKRGLNRIIDVMHASLAEHPRTFAVRIDLRYPLGLKTLPEARLIDRFISSLKSKIQHARIRAGRRAEYRVHQTSVRYVWGREIGQTDIVDFTLEQSPFDRFAKKFGASVAERLAIWMGFNGPQLR